MDRAFAAGRPELARARLADARTPFRRPALCRNPAPRRCRASGRSSRSCSISPIVAALPLVATNEPFFAQPGDFDAHDALLVHRRRGGVERRRPAARLARALFQDPRAKCARFSPIFRRGDRQYASRSPGACSFRPQTRKPILPRFVQATRDDASARRDRGRGTAPTGGEGLDAAPRRARSGAGTERERIIATRLDFELSVIEKMGFPGYFLIVADFIKWAKAHDIPVGPGRGSGAGSLVAYALTITDLDPLRFGLLFERFLNPERVSMPDFDIDFCQDRRDEVIDYVQRALRRATRWRRSSPSARFLARGVLRDVGRVLQMPYGQVDKLTKLVPQNPAKPVTLAKALAGEPHLREAAEEDERSSRACSNIARSSKGSTRNASTHAAGVVIGDRPLDELVPLYRDPKSDMPATQFNMKWVEPAGLVKFDFLGLKTLTVLATARRPARSGAASTSISPRIPLDDPDDLRDARRAARRSACSRWKARACARRWSR